MEAEKRPRSREPSLCDDLVSVGIRSVSQDSNRESRSIDQPEITSIQNEVRAVRVKKERCTSVSSALLVESSASPQASCVRIETYCCQYVFSSEPGTWPSSTS